MRSPTQVLRHLEKRGLLLVQDKTLPSVVGVVTGESLRGSWWAHPMGKQIFSVLNALVEHPDVLITKLVAGKDTLVHRRLWPALVSIVSPAQAWQLRALSAPARRLLERVSRERAVDVSGAPAKELASRLLVCTSLQHTASGKHVLRLESWDAWALRIACRSRLPAAAARHMLEEATIALGAPLSALPWIAAR
jgi:hypothetical protein